MPGVDWHLAQSHNKISGQFLLFKILDVKSIQEIQDCSQKSVASNIRIVSCKIYVAYNYVLKSMEKTLIDEFL